MIVRYSGGVKGFKELLIFRFNNAQRSFNRHPCIKHCAQSTIKLEIHFWNTIISQDNGGR